MTSPFDAPQFGSPLYLRVPLVLLSMALRPLVLQAWMASSRTAP